MPTYEYRCDDCSYQFEKFQNMTDPHLKECPKCGGKVQRLISSGAGLLFKGSGFYETDYKRKSDTCCDGDKKETCDSPKKCCEN
ncbi:zinc ribbon domain-containing protein [candidate division KSB1 bacterium]|nr:zinc ribbon domain-containing protein [candidate division KSB1 bacterium]